MDATTIRGLYEDLKRAKAELHQIALVRIEAKRTLDSAWLKGLADGAITGKNQVLRESSAAEELAEQYSALSTEEREARLELDLAQLDVNAMRDELRFLEVSRSPMPPLKMKGYKGI